MDRIAVFGAGVAGATFVKAAKSDGTAITLVDPKDFVEVPYAVHRGLMDPDGFGRTIRRPISEHLGVEHVQAKLQTLAPGSALLDDGREIPFDQAVIATGSTIRGFDNLKVAERRSIEAREQEWRGEHDRLREVDSVIVIGGGPVGVELIGEIVSAFPDKQVTLIHGPDRLLPDFGAGIGDKARKVFEQRGVRVILGQRASAQGDGRTVELASGEMLEADVVYTATGIVIDTSYLGEHFADRVNDRGQVIVDEFLRVKGTAHIYAVGDINDVSGMKLGAFGADQAKRVAQNLDAQREGRPMKAFKPMTKAVGIVTLGTDAGVFKLPIGRFDPLHRLKQKDMFASRFFGSDAPAATTQEQAA